MFLLSDQMTFHSAFSISFSTIIRSNLVQQFYFIMIKIPARLMKLASALSCQRLWLINKYQHAHTSGAPRFFNRSGQTGSLKILGDFLELYYVVVSYRLANSVEESQTDIFRFLILQLMLLTIWDDVKDDVSPLPPTVQTRSQNIRWHLVLVTFGVRVCAALVSSSHPNTSLFLWH